MPSYWKLLCRKVPSKDDEIYIVGEFNGGEDVAVEQLEWRLEKASNSEVKWGIYLIPSTFKDGKTLADGFYFFSKKNGAERTVKMKTLYIDWI